MKFFNNLSSIILKEALENKDEKAILKKKFAARMKKFEDSYGNFLDETTELYYLRKYNFKRPDEFLNFDPDLYIKGKK